MYTHRFFYLLIIALLMVAACAPQMQDTPITLRLAVADEEGRPSDPYIHEFINQVKSLSSGNITIEPIWEAGNTTEAGFEVGVIQLVKKGQYDLGLVASRAFDIENITSFQALQAPFLIDNDALSQAVATSDIATRMLENVSSTGIVGLTMWPEDLRHPFSLVPGKPILAPEDFTGLNVRATPSQATYDLINAMGGTPVMSDEYQAVESGLRQGASLTGTPTATGNVVFFAKFQVLFGNGPTLEKLSDAQRGIVRQATVATQKKAIAEHPSDVEAAAAWCADGGSIVLASDEQVAAFQQAAQPVFDKLQKDSFNADAISAIRELKTTTQPSPGAQACTSTVAIPTRASTESGTWSHDMLPNGMWSVELSEEDFVSRGVLKSNAKDWAGTNTYEFKDGQGVWRRSYGGQTDINICPFTYEVVEDFVRLTFHDTGLGNYACEGEWDDIQWSLDEEGLHFNVVNLHNAPIVEATAMYEAKPWQKVE